MSEEGPLIVRSQLENEQITLEKLSEACGALRMMYPGIRCKCQTECSEPYVIFGLRNSEDLRRFAEFIYRASIRPAAALLPALHVPREQENLVPKKIIYSGPATIVLWADGTKTVVKCAKHDMWDIHTGFLWALAEKVYGNRSQVEKVIDRHAHFNY